MQKRFSAPFVQQNFPLPPLKQQSGKAESGAPLLQRDDNVQVGLLAPFSQQCKLFALFTQQKTPNPPLKQQSGKLELGAPFAHGDCNVQVGLLAPFSQQ